MKTKQNASRPRLAPIEGIATAIASIATPRRLVPIDDALARLGGISKATLYSWISRQKGPPAIKIGSRLMFDESELSAWIAAQPRVGGRIAGEAA